MRPLHLDNLFFMKINYKTKMKTKLLRVGNLQQRKQKFA